MHINAYLDDSIYFKNFSYKLNYWIMPVFGVTVKPMKKHISPVGEYQERFDTCVSGTSTVFIRDDKHADWTKRNKMFLCFHANMTSRTQSSEWRQRPTLSLLILSELRLEILGILSFFSLCIKWNHSRSIQKNRDGSS